jgi:hypothetical protein
VATVEPRCLGRRVARALPIAADSPLAQAGLDGMSDLAGLMDEWTLHADGGAPEFDRELSTLRYYGRGV